MEQLAATAFNHKSVGELALGVYANNSPARRVSETLVFRGSEVVMRIAVGGEMWEVISMRQSRGASKLRFPHSEHRYPATAKPHASTRE